MKNDRKLVSIVEQCDFVLTKIDEGAEKPAGVLAVLEGETFVPGGVSRNERKYPQDFWPYVLRKGTELERIIDDKLLLGTVGHVEAAKDDLIRDGKISHVTTGLWIDENGKGMGRHFVLDTPVGKVLNTLLRSGCKLRTSTKGKGLFVEDNDTFSGSSRYAVPDKKSYILERVDFVCDPGFLEAMPEVMEALEEIESNSRRENMDEAKGPNGPSRVEEHFMKRTETLTEENARLRAANEAHEKTITGMKRQMGRISESVDSDTVKLIQRLEQYESLGTPKEIHEALKTAGSLLSMYQKLGTPAEIFECLDMTKGLISEGYGSPDEIKDALEGVAEMFEVIGTPPEVMAVLESIKGLRERCGSFPEIEEALNRSTEIISEQHERMIAEEGIRISEAFGVSPELVGRLFASHGNFTIVEEALSEVAKGMGDVSSRYSAAPRTTRFNEDKSVLPSGKSSLVGRILEQFNAGGPVAINGK